MPQIVFTSVDVSNIPNIPWENRGTWGQAVDFGHGGGGSSTPGTATSGPVPALLFGLAALVLARLPFLATRRGRRARSPL